MTALRRDRRLSAASACPEIRGLAEIGRLCDSFQMRECSVGGTTGVVSARGSQGVITLATSIAGLRAGHRLRAFLFLALAALGLTACGGGGGGSPPPPPPPPPPPSVAFSTTSVTFSAASPWAAQPANQFITGTVSGAISGNLFIIIQVNNPELVSVPVQTVIITSPTTGQGTIIPVLPSSLGSGTHTGTLTVRVCLNDPTCATGNLAGSPRTINLTYSIPTTVERDTVTPYVVDSNFAGQQIILRGSGFTATSTASLGGNAATVQFVSGTELRVTPPAAVLNVPGTYSIQVTGGTFGGSLAVVSPAVFPADFLPHPASPWATKSLEYDAVRRALFVTGGSAGGTELKRYNFDTMANDWAAPAQAPGPLPAGLRQLRMSHDGSALLALAATDNPVLATAIYEYAPTSFAVMANTSLQQDPANSPIFAESFALSNDGSLILQTRLAGSGTTYPVRFDTQDRVFTHLIIERDQQLGSVAPGNGSFVLLDNGTPPMIRYNSSTASITRGLGGRVLLPVFSGQQPSADLTGARFQSAHAIVDSSFLLLGYTSDAGVAAAAVINRAGTRAHVFEPAGNGQIRTYDLTVAATGSPLRYAELAGSPTALPVGNHPGTAAEYRMTITPDGGTVFISGSAGITVQPVPL